MSSEYHLKFQVEMLCTTFKRNMLNLHNLRVHINVLIPDLAIEHTQVTVSDEEDATPNDDNICNEIINGEAYMVVTCDYKDRNPPLRGRYVTFRRKENAANKEAMILCEVEVLSCLPGRWGYNSSNSHEDCTSACDRCRYVSETCRVSDGYCFTGCQDGFWGGSCHEQCNCTDGAPCNRTNGSCGKSEQESQTLILRSCC